MFFIGICHAYFRVTNFRRCLKERYSIDFNPNKDLIYFCRCRRPRDKVCVTPYPCWESTPNDLSQKYKKCTMDTDPTIIPYLELELKEAKVKRCKKEGEIPTGGRDLCCGSMVTNPGKPCEPRKSSSSGPCSSHRQCQLDHEGYDYVCCYEYYGEKPKCVPNHKCPKFQLISE